MILCLRPLGNRVDQAARRTVAIEHRSRTAQHLDARQRVGIGPVLVPVAAVQKAHPVEIRDRSCSAHQFTVTARIRTIGVRVDARYIAQRLLQRCGALVADFVRRHDRYRLRNLADRRVGLGCGRAAVGEIAIDLAERTFDRRRSWRGFDRPSRLLADRSAGSTRRALHIDRWKRCLRLSGQRPKNADQHGRRRKCSDCRKCGLFI